MEQTGGQDRKERKNFLRVKLKKKKKMKKKKKKKRIQSGENRRRTPNPQTKQLGNSI